MQRVIECVPNFSEGRDPEVVRRITEAIESVEGVELLDVDSGRATNRTVVTFAGEPEAVVEAAVRAARRARELIDMRRHRGEHPRFGALDVCPLVPVAGVTMEETVAHARELGRRLGEEVGLTVYLYEHAATDPSRRNLADVRAGEYEGLPQKLADPRWKPDFGPAEFDARSGATAVGARNFLIAYNVNLNTTSTRRANAIAFDVREKGRIKREPDPLTGEIVRDEKGEPVWVPGSLKAVKAIGWYIEEYGICQISMNLTDISVTPLHVAFDEVCRRADARGVRVTGSEIVGLVPLRTMLDAGRYFLRKQKRSTGVSDRELIHIAIRSLGLDELAPFDPERKIVEYALRSRRRKGPALVERSVEDYVAETARESVAPGGGSAAALVGALGAALGTMVANLSAHKRGWDDRWEEFSQHAERGKRAWTELTRLVDEDTAAFHAVLAAHRMPETDEDERRAKAEALRAATERAIHAPLRVMETALAAMDVIRDMAAQGLPSSASDAGVGALCALAAVRGAGLNVKTNLADLDDETERERLRARATELEETARRRAEEVEEIVERRIRGDD